MLGEKGEGAQVENFIAVVVHELQDLLQEELGALVLDVPLGGCQQGTNRIDSYTTLRDRNTQYWGSFITNTTETTISPVLIQSIRFNHWKREEKENINPHCKRIFTVLDNLYRPLTCIKPEQACFSSSSP